MFILLISSDFYHVRKKGEIISRTLVPSGMSYKQMDPEEEEETPGHHSIKKNEDETIDLEVADDDNFLFDDDVCEFEDLGNDNFDEDGFF